MAPVAATNAAAATTNTTRKSMRIINSFLAPITLHFKSFTSWFVCKNFWISLFMSQQNQAGVKKKKKKKLRHDGKISTYKYFGYKFCFFFLFFQWSHFILQWAEGCVVPCCDIERKGRKIEINAWIIIYGVVDYVKYMCFCCTSGKHRDQISKYVIDD